ncbi:MAG TPA: class I SAM-dependent methyltransferase [Candidatus Paceibacterota bacterium]|nr:class I SAM-dependent methyltransferase [Candidatus Paceibacterota bacterium]
MDKWNDIWLADHNDIMSVGPSAQSRIRLVKNLIIRLYKPDSSILDVGCGSGRLLASLSRYNNFSTLTGVDISPSAINLASQSCPAGRFEIVDIEKEKLNEKFDLITCIATLDILENDVAALENISAMLKSGGNFVVAVQHEMKYWNRLNQLRGYRRYSLHELKEKCSDQGLRYLESFTWGWPLYHWYYKIFLARFDEKLQNNKAGSLTRAAAKLLSFLFMADDIFINNGKGDWLFAVFQK